jgi:hypothetical protein
MNPIKNELTDEQKTKIDNIYNKRYRLIWAGEIPFKLDNYYCEEYLKIDNGTGFRATCWIETDLIDEVVIKAIFYGASGSPIRRGVIPRRAVNVPYPLMLHIYYISLNFLKRIIHWKKK